MNFKLIFGLSFFGIAMGFATTYFMSSMVETFCWLPLFICSAWLIARYAKTKHFLHGFLVGFADYVWVIAIRVLLSSEYLAHHSREAQQYAVMNKDGIDIVTGMILTGALYAVFNGVVLGAFSSIAFNMRGRIVN